MSGSIRHTLTIGVRLLLLGSSKHNDRDPDFKLILFSPTFDNAVSTFYNTPKGGGGLENTLASYRAK